MTSPCSVSFRRPSTEPGAWATGARLTASGDLTNGTLAPIRAGGEAESGQWSLNAERGSFSKDGGLTLEQARGTFRGGGRQADAQSPKVLWRPGANLVEFRGGFTAHSPADGLEVSAQSATYDRAARSFRASGNVHAKVQGAAIQGRTLVYRLGHGADEAVVETGR